MRAAHRSAEGGGLDRKAFHQRPKAYGSAHGVAEQVPGPRKPAVAGRADQGRHVHLVIGETFDVADGRIVGQAVGQSLAAPIDRDQGEAHTGNGGGGAAVFFEVLGATGEQKDGTAVPAGPDADPEPDAVRSVSPERFGGRPFGDIQMVGRGLQGQARIEPRRIATPMSPSIARLPDM